MDEVHLTYAAFFPDYIFLVEDLESLCDDRREISKNSDSYLLLFVKKLCFRSRGPCRAPGWREMPGVQTPRDRMGLEVLHVTPLTAGRQQVEGSILRAKRQGVTVKIRIPKGEVSQESFLESFGNFSHWS